MKRTAQLAAGALVLTLGAAACASGNSKATVPAGSPPVTAPSAAPEVNPAGDIPDTQAFVSYTPPTGGFTVKVPEGWARTEAGGAVTFTDKLNSVRMESLAAPSAPTVQSAQQTEIPAIQASARSYQAGTVTTVTRRAGPAVLITYRADAAPDPVTGKVVRDEVERYEFWNNGTEVVLTLSGPQGADNVDPWRIVTDSFGWKP